MTENTVGGEPNNVSMYLTDYFTSHYLTCSVSIMIKGGRFRILRYISHYANYTVLVFFQSSYTRVS